MVLFSDPKCCSIQPTSGLATAALHLLLLLWSIDMVASKSSLSTDERFRNLPCASYIPERFDSAETGSVKMLGDAYQDPPARITDIEAALTNVSSSPEDVFYAIGRVGGYKGVANVVEYYALTQPSLNGNAAEFSNIRVVSARCSIHQDQLFFKVAYDVHRHGQLVSNIVNEYEFWFESGTHLIVNATTSLPFEIFQALLTDVPTAEEICDEAALRCPGPLFPYQDLQSCYEILGRRPLYCKKGYCDDCYEKNAGFQGDTRLCRSLHMISAKARPVVHCPHMAEDSVKCYKEACPAEDLLPTSTVPFQRFDATLPHWARVLELVVGALLLIVPMLSFMWYRRLRVLFLPESMRGMAHDEQPEGTITSQAFSTASSTVSLPSLRCSFKLSLRGVFSAEQDATVLATQDVQFGGCRLTGIVGPSGCGKSTLMKLLCGIPQDHMTLHTSREFQKVAVDCIYVPQSTMMWPRTMLVRDLLLFSSTLHGLSGHERPYAECLDILQLRPLLDQTFGSLSGGQQQRVHLLCLMFRPRPAVLFMDEPLAAQDEANALACLELLRSLPFNHSFVITMHQMTPDLHRSFDEILEIDPTSKSICASSSNLPDQNNETDTSHKEYAETLSLPQLKGFNSSLVLWHAQFFGWPVVEAVVILLVAICGLLLGSTGEYILQRDPELDNSVPTSDSIRIPIIMAQILVTVTLVSAFGVSIVFSGSERPLLDHCIAQGDINATALVLVGIFRSLWFGIAESLAGVVISLAMMDLLVASTDTIILTSALFVGGHVLLCYALGMVARPKAYAFHAVLLVTLLAMFFSGQTFNYVPEVTQILHYLNPLFYTYTACMNIIFQSYDPNCDKLAYPYLACGDGEKLRELSGLQDIGANVAQAAIVLSLLLSCALMLVCLKTPTKAIAELKPDNCDSSESSEPSSVRGRSSARSSVRGRFSARSSVRERFSARSSVRGRSSALTWTETVSALETSGVLGERTSLVQHCDLLTPIVDDEEDIDISAGPD